jgi:hypothetical protein
MAVDHIRYDMLAQDALRGVVHDVLADAAKRGLPGDHHFYITFDTRAEGVRISPRLREQYPEDITIILQHQFWDLAVREEEFEVGLSFSGVPEKLTVPFEAIKSFFDPSVQFGLQFETIEASAGDATSVPSVPADGKKTPKVRRPAQHRESGRPVSPPPPPANPVAEDDPDKPTSGGEVVRLDRFRKK